MIFFPARYCCFDCFSTRPSNVHEQNHDFQKFSHRFRPCECMPKYACAGQNTQHSANLYFNLKLFFDLFKTELIFYGSKVALINHACTLPFIINKRAKNSSQLINIRKKQSEFWQTLTSLF